MEKIYLMYHDVYIHDKFESGFLRDRDMLYKMSVDLFHEHVKTVSDFCVESGSSKDAFVFTFDDGGKSFISVIAPILEKYGFKGLFFITTEYIGHDTFLSEDDIRELRDRGHIIGSHAHTHEHLYLLSDSQVEEEWKISTSILNDILTEPVRCASIPNGDISKRVIESAHKCGLNVLYSSQPTTRTFWYNNVEVKGRYVILENHSTTYLMSIINSPFKRWFLMARSKVIQIIKSLLGENYIRLKSMILR